MNRSLLNPSFPWLVLCIFFLVNPSVLAQDFICGNTGGPDQLIPSSISPKVYEARYRDYVQQPSHARSAGVVYTIPVVVHIIHDCRPLGSPWNPTDGQVRSALNGLTNRFRHTSGETFDNPFSGVDTEIEFCLATTDPNGNYTTGIYRYTDPDLAKRSYDADFSAAIRANEWPLDKYLNIYVVGDSDPPFGGLASSAYVYVSSIGAGILTHEIGHYLSLPHIMWGDCANGDCLTNGDRICDTPPAIDPRPSCSQNDVNSCTTDADDLSTNNPYRPIAAGGLGDVPDLAENYMHWRGNCWKAFSVGQGNRMRFNIETARMSQVNHAAVACQTRPFPNHDAGITVIASSSNNCSSTFTGAATLKNFGLSNLSAVDVVVEIDGLEVHRQSWTGSLNQDQEEIVDLTFALPIMIDITQIKVFTETPNGMIDGFTGNDASCLNFESFTGRSIPYQPNLLLGGFPDGWSAENLDLSFGWQPVTRNLGTLEQPCQEARIEFLGNTEGQVASLMMPSLDFRGYSSVQLTFDMAHIARQLQGVQPNTRLFIDVTDDCGQTRTVVYDKSNLELTTNDPPSYDDRFPNCDEFRSEVIDLSAYDGKDNIQIRINAEGWFISYLFLQNFLIDGELAPCSITNIFGNPGLCIDDAHYDAYLTLIYDNPHAGNVIINGQSFPVEINVGDIGQQVVLQDLPSDGNPVPVSAHFESNPTCSLVVDNLFTAPPVCYPECVITGITAGESTLDPFGNTYSQLITVSWAGPLQDYGPLSINGGWPYEPVSAFTATGFSFSSGGITVRLIGLPADGQPVDISAAFNDQATCTRTENELYTAPQIISSPECIITDVIMLSIDGHPESNAYTLKLSVSWEGENGLQDEDLILNGMKVDSLLGQSISCTVTECQGAKSIVVPNLPGDGMPFDLNLQFENRSNCVYSISAFFTAPLYNVCNESEITLPNLPAAPEQLHHAIESITSSAILDEAVHDMIGFQAGIQIALEPLFEVANDVVFEADIKPCVEAAFQALTHPIEGEKSVSLGEVNQQHFGLEGNIFYLKPILREKIKAGNLRNTDGTIVSEIKPFNKTSGYRWLIPSPGEYELQLQDDLGSKVLHLNFLFSE